MPIATQFSGLIGLLTDNELRAEKVVGRWLRGEYQTAGDPKPIKPGETVVLWDNYDAAEHFLLTEPSTYVVFGSPREPL